MFHTYVLNARGVPIDIDRASYLMDKALWEKARGKAILDRQTDPQVAWETYCDWHQEKYGKPFGTSVRPDPL